MGIGSFITGFLKRIKPLTATLSAEPPPVLYHYTKLQGVLGIVNSKALWATDIRYLNDEKEFHYTLDITRSLLMELRDSGAKAAYAALIPSLLSKIDAVSASGVFVTCFTGNGDLLSQWRGYCGPEVGCSVGWAGKTLRAAAHSAGFMLAPCIYERDRQRQLVQGLLDSAFADEPQRDIGDADIDLFLNVSLSLIAPLCKHPSFHEEAEWRFFTRPGISKIGPLQFRAGKAAIIPYVQVPLQTAEGRLADVERLVVGPTPLPALSAQAVRTCLATAGINVNEVVPSAAPYRSV